MGNLGGYQIITNLAKKLGGPLNLIIVSGLGGYILLRSGEFGITKIIKNNKCIKESQLKYKNQVFNITRSRKDSSGLQFNIGEQFHILEFDGEVVLIKKTTDNSIPCFISTDFLKTISDIT